MKFMENWKRFWTLNRHHAAGFTLVELIVVIAILAILAGVAVPAYSGYIAEANKQADMSLISEIEQALTLAGYNGKLTCGYVILSTDGTPKVSSTDVHNALVATFGENYADTLKLTYGDWGNNGLFDNLMPLTADAVVKSSYLTGNRTDKLLTDVEILTGMSQKLVDALDGVDDDQNKTFSDIFTKDGVCVLDETAAKYGLDKGSYDTWEDWAAANADNKTAYGNLLVMTAADEFDKAMSATEDNPYEMTAASSTILQFSTYYAFAAQNPEFSATLDQYMGHLDGTATVPGLNPVTNSLSGATWYTSLGNAASAFEGFDEFAASQAGMDQTAFLTIMSGLGNPTEDQAAQIGKDMSNPNLFTGGTVNGMYNDFISGAEAMAGMYDANDPDNAMNKLNLANGNVAILFSNNKGQLTAVNTIS